MRPTSCVRYWSIWLLGILAVSVFALPLNAQSAAGGGQHAAFEGSRGFAGLDRFGPDSVDLQNLGLTLTQELSTPFRANDLPYQVMAYYTGSGWSKKKDLSTSAGKKHLWFTPSTVWGPLGAGWNVHMGKLLSTGRSGVDILGRRYYIGLTSSCTDVPLCSTYDPDNNTWVDRGVRNTILDAGGTLTSIGDACVAAVGADYTWNKVESDESVCHGVPGWRAPDGTRYELNEHRLVRSITDLSGNKVEIDYYDPGSLSQVRDCATNPSWCNYEVQLQDVWWYLEGDIPTHEVMMPLRSIRDSNGRRIDFVLTDAPYGGKYRIKEIRSVSPAGTEAVYKLFYEERNVRHYVDVVPAEFWGAATPEQACGVGSGLGGACIAPEMDGSVVNQVIENVAFLVKVERPDGASVEYDYYPWGDLKAVRTLHGGTIKYTWGYWERPERESWPWESYAQFANVAASGIKLVGREVRSRGGEVSPGTYEWRFEKNFLPAHFDGADLYDQDRTIVTTPEGNETAYRFSEFGPIRNVKIYAGRAIRWLQADVEASAANISSPATGRLLREINRWQEQGYLYADWTLPVITNVDGPEPAREAATQPRVVREETYYLDDPIAGLPSGDITQDWWYDIKGTTFAFDQNGGRKRPKEVFSYSAWALEGWQRGRGYRFEIQDGSALGARRIREKKFTDLDNLTPDEVRAESLNFKWPLAWVREREISGPTTSPRITESLTEYEYDATLIHKIKKEIHRKNPAGAVPNDHPYASHPNGSNGDVTRSYEFWPGRSATLPVPPSPVGTPYGLPRRIVTAGGDPVTTVEGASGDSGVIYDETLEYDFGVVKRRQLAGVSWKSLDALISPSGHVSESRDAAGVITQYRYDAGAELIEVLPGGASSAEHPVHLEKDLRDVPAESSEFLFAAGRKLFGQVAWRGPAGASYRTDPACAFLSRELDGLGRIVRQERKMADGTFVERRLEYGVALADGTHRGGFDRLTREEEWVPVGAATRPATARLITFEGLNDPLLQGRIDPFSRYWKTTAPDGATEQVTHFGLSASHTVSGIQGVSQSSLSATTTYYRDLMGRLRVLDGPSQAADAVYEYDLFGNVVKANLVAQAQPAPASDGSTVYTDRFSVANPDEHVRSFQFDGLGRLRLATNPENGTVHYHAYDPIGLLLLSDDENGTILRRRYDPAGRLTRLERCQPAEPNVECEPTTPGVVLTELVYHNSTQVAARGASLGKLITLKGHDDSGPLLSQQEFFYEELNGRLSEQRTAFRDWTLGSTIESGTSPFYPMRYTYHPDGTIKKVIYPYSWDAPWLVASVDHASQHGWTSSVQSSYYGIGASLRYHPSGLVSEIAHGNGTKTLVGTDSRGRVASIDVRTAAGADLWKTGAHRYDGAGNLYEIGESSGSFPSEDFWRFAYDPAQRLVWAKLAGHEVSYAYDAFGNMTAQTFAAGSPPVPAGMSFANRSYTGNKVQDPAYSYDPNGDMRDAEGRGFDYDALSRLTAVGGVDGNGQLMASGVYRYSGAGLRSSKEDRTTGWTTFYFRDVSGEVLSEYSRPSAGGVPAWSRDYIYGAGRHLAVVENGPPTSPGGFATCAQADGRSCNQPAGTNAVTLDWTGNPETDIYGYRVYRASNPDQFDPASGLAPPTRLHPGEITASFFADLSAKTCAGLGQEYCWYAVTGVDRSGKEGPFSPPLAVQYGDTSAPGAPRQLHAGATSTTISLSWSPPTDIPQDFLGYYVYRGTASNDPAPQRLNAAPVTGTSLTDVGLLCATTYYYRLKSVDTASNESSYSTEVAATTGSCSTGGKKRAEAGPSWKPDREPGQSLAIAGIAEAVGFASAPHQAIGQAVMDWVGYTLHTDHLGSIRLVTNAAQQVVARHRYFPFGQEIGPISKSPSPHRYIGREWDAESGLLYLMARYAQPTGGGRFTTVDPLAGSTWRAESLNRYAYALNAPLRYLDRFGLAAGDGDGEGDDDKPRPKRMGQEWWRERSINYSEGDPTRAGGTSSSTTVNSANAGPGGGGVPRTADSEPTSATTPGVIESTFGSGSYEDFNVAYGENGFVGTGGIIFTTNGQWYFYLGGGVGTPGLGFSVTGNITGEVSPGWTWAGSGGYGPFGQYGGLIGVPNSNFSEGGSGVGVSLVVFYVFGPFGGD